MKSRLRELYEKEVIPKLQEEFGYKNKMAVPRLEKIVINMGVGEATQNIKALDSAMKELSLITGQWPSIRRAKKSISAFRVRKGQAIGCTVTLRGERMYEFFDRLVNIVLPRVRDFRGVSPRSFDGRGNYTLGLKDQLVFPEIDYSKVEKPRGMNITIVTTAKTNEEGYALLKYLGMPFRER
ncbi:50S ribosomal protein L5 [Candidatus Aminicenantes bacterium AC-708-M15]|jgi:large subunit ribosomal protein L5|nr:50S ribosomal protein L5 [SCandidatus Aminicenantes bacterium Aminicenantia_JdfR_composite]MCP2599123.1 50S ribosomal protein L5 [Candidatus Aminicenantes bacterium AC-335-B20]MCP2604072.1 50S ribosomal protein L5 [Candidatus Aminicenantes bacterium AC-708-M15]MCP2605361.1 50S ribosomal protein L5 [Candidatus Aminicenantes bacterium AC-335-O07]MCP2606028.1 50S ribosomal protein L5 [Candidatus Aminicenantes bacterium AC-708-I09]MCP2617872.1 50S ribosomal protein L5 [Candidatus Aminicenantes 